MSEEVNQTELLRVRRWKEYEAKLYTTDWRTTADLYNEWSQVGYEEDLRAVKHKGRLFTTDKISRAFHGNKETARIMDVAAGSGMFGEALLEKGFKLIDALDCSQGMLDMARSKNVYQQYFCNFMEDIDGVIDNDTYDIVASLAAIGPGHLKAAAIRQMFRITKPGGLICFAGVKKLWEENPDYHRMCDCIKELEDSSKVKMLENIIIEEYYFYEDWAQGILVLMQKM